MLYTIPHQNLLEYEHEKSQRIIKILQNIHTCLSTEKYQWLQHQIYFKDIEDLYEFYSVILKKPKKSIQDYPILKEKVQNKNLIKGSTGLLYEVLSILNFIEKGDSPYYNTKKTRIVLDIIEKNKEDYWNAEKEESFHYLKI